MELSEETSLEFNSVSLINEVGLIEDLNNGVIDVCCSLKIKGDGKLDSEVSNEYRKFFRYTLTICCIGTFYLLDWTGFSL